MAENENTGAGAVGGEAANGETAPQAGLLAQYVKDLSFENPNAPASLQAAVNKQPAIDVNINVGVKRASEDVFEVELKVSATASHENENGEKNTSFVVELVYGGLFGIRNVPEDSMKQFLLINAPTLMFPFARRIIADASRDGGFPPLLLDPISFEALYQQQLAQEQAQAPANDGAAEESPFN